MDAKLKKLVAELAQVCWDGGSLDGGELQDMLLEAGVLTGVVVDEPCGAICRCREYDAGQPPWVCYRLTTKFAAKRQRS